MNFYLKKLICSQTNEKQTAKENLRYQMDNQKTFAHVREVVVVFFQERIFFAIMWKKTFSEVHSMATHGYDIVFQ